MKITAILIMLFWVLLIVTSELRNHNFWRKRTYREYRKLLDQFALALRDDMREIENRTREQLNGMHHAFTMHEDKIFKDATKNFGRTADKFKHVQSDLDNIKESMDATNNTINEILINTMHVPKGIDSLKDSIALSLEELQRSRLSHDLKEVQLGAVHNTVTEVKGKTMHLPGTLDNITGHLTAISNKAQRNQNNLQDSLLAMANTLDSITPIVRDWGKAQTENIVKKGESHRTLRRRLKECDKQNSKLSAAQKSISKPKLTYNIHTIGD